VESLHIGNTETERPKALRYHNLEWIVSGARQFLDGAPLAIPVDGPWLAETRALCAIRVGGFRLDLRSATVRIPWCFIHERPASRHAPA
jgi:hypothetical protein